MLDNNRHNDSTSHLSSVLGCPNPSSQVGGFSWFALRIAHSRELKVKEMLDKKGVRTFVPMICRRRRVGDKIEKQLIPAVTNICFVFWTRDKIDSFIRNVAEKMPVQYYCDPAGAPIIVPEKSMCDFMTIASSMDEELIYLTEISSKFQESQSVKVKSGTLAGVKGKLVRIRKSRRILVELPGMLAIASAFVKPEDVETLN